MNQFTRRVVIGLLLGVAVYGVFVLYTGYRDLRDALADFRWAALGGALALASLNYGLRFLKWEYYLGKLEIRHVPKFESLLVFLSGFVLTITPGKVGEVFKSAVLQSTHGVSLARTAPIVIAERLTDVIAIIALIALGSAGFSGGLPWAAAGTSCVLLGMLFIIWERPVQAVLDALEQRPGASKRWAPKLREAYSALRVLAGPTALFYPSLLSFVGWSGEGIALWLLLQGFGADVSLPLSAFFYATATLAGALVPVPGGLGVAEAMLQTQLVGLGGVEPGPATAAMLMIRFATLWFAVIVGFVALAILRRQFPRLLVARNGEVTPPQEASG